jgi:hypothetical protein
MAVFISKRKYNMKNAILLLLLIWFALPSAAQTDKIEVDLTQAGKPYTLEVSQLHGNIHLTKHAGKNLILEVSINTHTHGTTKDGMRRISADGEYLRVEEKNNHVKVSNGRAYRPVHLVIHAPEDGHFVLKTINNGNVVVENISGQFEVTNVNGKIALMNVTGSAVASTINGKIEAKFLHVKPSTPMAFSTLNGSIDLSFPGNMKANVKAKTDRGEILSDFDIGALNNESTITKSQAKGMTRIEASRWLTGSINQGGPELMIKTVNGNIYIRRNK